MTVQTARTALIVALLAWTTALDARQTSQPSAQPAIAPVASQEINFSGVATITSREAEALEELLASPDWPLRTMAVLRLRAHQGDAVNAALLGRFEDAAPQTRAFALREASLRGIAVDPRTFAKEKDPHVIRELLRAGARLDNERLSDIARPLIADRAVDRAMLGIEIAALSTDKQLRTRAAVRTRQIIQNMNDSVAMLLSERLSRVLDIHDPPLNTNAWRYWIRANRGRTPLLDAAILRSRLIEEDPTPVVAQISSDRFTNLLDYLGALRKRDLDLVIIMDSTQSMEPMIAEARIGVDSLILFLSDISASMRLAFIAYRDHDNKPVWEGHPFTTNVDDIRRFLFDVRITGGRDRPEAVYDGVAACAQLDWREDAVKEAVLIGDAPPHERDLYQLSAFLDELQNQRIALHTAHIPMRFPEGLLGRLDPAVADEESRELINYNRETAERFADIAKRGGGRATRLLEPGDLVPAIMHFTLEEPWWPVFDDFYARYVDLCR